MQHVYAFMFASLITGLIATYILYYDYGFWHDHYTKNNSLEVVTKGDIATSTVVPKSPFEIFSDFVEEAKKRSSAISFDTGKLLQGKETYIKESE
jgi:hypothetical protein